MSLVKEWEWETLNQFREVATNLSEESLCLVDRILSKQATAEEIAAFTEKCDAAISVIEESPLDQRLGSGPVGLINGAKFNIELVQSMF